MPRVRARRPPQLLRQRFASGTRVEFATPYKSSNRRARFRAVSKILTRQSRRLARARGGMNCQAHLERCCAPATVMDWPLPEPHRRVQLIQLRPAARLVGDVFLAAAVA